jgi:hypothetical protein
MDLAKFNGKIVYTSVPLYISYFLTFCHESAMQNEEDK